MIVAELKRGLVTENPLLVLALGLCPAVAVSTSVVNGLGMGIATLLVLVFSNAIISLTRSAIPERVRIPSYIVIIATFVTIVDLLLEARLPELDRQLGIFVPLIVVNCIVLGRAEAFASKNPLWKSIVDGFVMGLGFTVALVAVSAVRELLGSNRLAGLMVFPGYSPMTVFLLAPGGFFALALVMALVNHARRSRRG